MTLLPCIRLLALLALFFSAAFATATDRVMDRATLNRLATLQQGASQVIERFPVGAIKSASIRFERVQIYSADAHLYAMTADGRKEVPRSNRIFLRGYSDDGTARVAMSLNADSSFADGSGTGPEGLFVLTSNTPGVTKLAAGPLESTLPPGFKFDYQCGNENKDLDVHSLDDLARRLGASQSIGSASTITAATHALRFATVAVDTDSLYMSKLFANNTTSASNWIASMFNVMNTMYERDLFVRLYVGTTFYQTAATDPYTTLTAGASQADLNFFSNYWRVNHPTGSPTRAFTILLSGLQSSTSNSCSAAGRAWVDKYCQAGFASGANTVGSYSVNEVCTSTNPGFGPPFSALLVGHELGHNFGADHTHCTDTTTGASRVATNTIDQCYNGESSQGCYAGATSCPASGPGAPAGTIMSYCNFPACGLTGQNVLQFHPTHITKVLLPDIIAAPAGCLNTTDDIFYNGFE